MSDERFITAILTQAVEDAKYTGTNKKKLKHKIEALRWIEDDDPQFKYYCRLLNIEPSYVKNKIKNHTDTSFTKKQKPMVKTIVAALLKNKNYERKGR